MEGGISTNVNFLASTSPIKATDVTVLPVRGPTRIRVRKVEHGDTQLSVKSSESERLKLELQQMRSMVAQQATRFEEEKQLLKHGVISTDLPPQLPSSGTVFMRRFLQV